MDMAMDELSKSFQDAVINAGAYYVKAHPLIACKPSDFIQWLFEEHYINISINKVGGAHWHVEESNNNEHLLMFKLAFG
jgi:hypothetical protein